MATYGTFTPTDPLSVFVDRYLDEKVSRTALFKTAFSQILMERAQETVEGSRIEWPIMKGVPGNATWFNVYGTGDGGTASEPQQTVVAQSSTKNIGAAFKVNDLKLSQGSSAQRRNYLQNQLEEPVRDVAQQLNRSLYGGVPTTNSQEPLGLDHTIDWFNGASTYAGLTRSVSRSLIGNYLAATLTGTDTGGSSSAVNATKGSASISWTTALTASKGDIVEITSGGETRRYYFAAAVSNTTSGTLTSQYEGATTTTGTIKVYSPFPTSEYGPSGEFSLAKANRAIALSSDADETPNLIVCDSMMHEKFMNEQVSTDEALVRNDLKAMGASNVTGFEYRGALVQVDNNAPARKIYFLNTNFWSLYVLPGYSSVRLWRYGLIPEAAVTFNSYANLIGQVLWSGELCCKAPNRNAIIASLNQ